jgi:hypothetical protein
MAEDSDVPCSYKPADSIRAEQSEDYCEFGREQLIRL